MMSKSAIQPRLQRHSPRALLGLLGCLFLLVWSLGGCGREVTFVGAECAADFRLMAKESQPRLGCLVFSHLKSAQAVIFTEKNGFWEMFYCPTSNYNDCSISAAPVRFGNVKNADEIAVVAFPPLSESATHSSASSFLAFCAKRFAPTNPTVPRCQNDGSQQTVGELKDCWTAFHFKYNRSKGRGVCTRWAQLP